MTPVKNLADGSRLCSLRACDFVPHLHGFCSQLAVMVGRNIVSRNVKMVDDRVMNGNETREMSG